MGELWVKIGVGINGKCSAVRRLAHFLLLPKRGAFPSRYALTRCDTVSSFYGKEKKSAWETWKCFPEVTEAFLVSSNPIDGVLSDNSISTVDLFISLMHDKKSYLRKKAKLLITYRQLEML